MQPSLKIKKVIGGNIDTKMWNVEKFIWEKYNYKEEGRKNAMKLEKVHKETDIPHDDLST